MNKQKHHASQADSNVSAELRLAILVRDSWRCQNCGGMQRLEVHHQLFRSHGGADDPNNLITLCGECHKVVHDVGHSAVEVEI